MGVKVSRALSNSKSSMQNFSKNFVKKLIGIAILLAAGFAASTPAHAVVFGTEITNASQVAPWVASIWYSESADATPEFICTGSLISADIILTAAHCSFDTGFYWVKMKADTLDGPEPLLEVAGVWRHERYSDKTTQNDMGLLKLTKPVQGIAPVVIPTQKEISAVNSAKSFQILGWGLNQQKRTATYLRLATLDNQDSAALRVFGKYFNKNTMLAAGKYISAERLYAGGCNGDSGGPLTARIAGKTFLVGVTSWGSQKCDSGKPTIFTRLTYYIKDIVRGKAIVTASASRYNRALPHNEEKANITGSASSGSRLTCDPGVWSSNTTTTSLEWTSPARIAGTNRAIVEVTSADAGEKFVCEVTGKSAAGEVTSQATMVMPDAPKLSSPPSISGYTSGQTPKVGTVVSCVGTKWVGSELLDSVHWFSAAYSTNGAPNSPVDLNQTGNLTLTKQVITDLQGKYLYCRVQAMKQGFIASAWTNVSVPYIAAPNPKLTLVGYDGYAPPSAGTRVDCTVENASDYDSVTYEWSVRRDSYGAVTAVVGNTSSIPLDAALIMTAKEKYLVCNVKVTNIGGTTEKSESVYVKAPVAPASANATISGVSGSTLQVGSVATCSTRGILKDESISYTWGAGDLNNSSIIVTPVGNSPTLTITQDIYDQITGGPLVCSISIRNLAGEVNAATAISVSAPTIQKFTANGHYYKYVSGRTTWADARNQALGMTYNGMQGYLATPNSAAENSFIQRKGQGLSIWLGASDIASEGCWRWADGPEANAALFGTVGTPNCTIDAAGSYSNWTTGEPNNANANENVAMMYLGNGQWNDLRGSLWPSMDSNWYANFPSGFVVEFGGTVNAMLPAPAVDVTPKLNILSPSSGVTAKGQFAITGTLTLDRALGTATSWVGIKVTGGSGFSASSYSPRMTSTFAGASGAMYFGSTIADYGWGQTGNNFSISLDSTSWTEGTYTITIFAMDDGNRTSSTSFTIVVPPSIRGVSATPIAGSATSLAVSWIAPLTTTGLSDYLIEYSPNGGSYTTFTRGTSTSTSVTVTGLTASTAYTFRITPIYNGTALTVGQAVSAPVSTSAPLLFSTTSFATLSDWITGGDIAPVLSNGKLRITQAVGGRVGAIKKTKIALENGVDISFRVNFNTGSSTPGDGLGLVLVDANNADIASAPATAGTWLGWGGGALGYNGDSPVTQMRGGLMSMQIMLNGVPTIRVMGPTGTNAVLNPVRSTSISNPYGMDTYYRMVIDPSSIPVGSRTYKIYISTTGNFSSTPVITGLLQDAGLNLNDPSGGFYLGFVGATGANRMNADIDQLNVYGVAHP